MRTLIIIVAGCVLAAVLLAVLKRDRRAPVPALAAFALGWLLFCLWNLVNGVSHGYSVAEELPILLVNYLVPLAVAFGLRRRLGMTPDHGRPGG